MRTKMGREIRRMPLNGALAKTGAALSCRKRLVAQCFEPDFGYGTVAAKFKN
jgi:hypothetical protein